jgi:beta-mannosidase
MFFRRLLIALWAVTFLASVRGAEPPAYPSPSDRLSLSGYDWKVFPLTPNYAEWGDWRDALQKDAPLDPLKVGPPPLFCPMTAHVPGAVQDDCQRAGVIADPYAGLNAYQAEWISQREWIYTREFVTPPALKGHNAHLHFEGVDYECSVFLNGKALGSHKGMYEPFEYDVTNIVKWGAANHLSVVLRPAPEMQPQVGRTTAVKEWKARFPYHWDFSTRLIPLGIWDDVWVDFDGPARFRDVWVRPALNAALTQATLNVQATLDATRDLEGLSLEAVIQSDVTAAPASGANTQRVALDSKATLKSGEQVRSFQVPLAKVKLWWPNGYGPQTLNTLTLNLRNAAGEVVATHTETFGLRSLRAGPNDDAAPDALPYTVVINNRKIFIKGWNWVPADLLYGRADAARYERLLSLVQRAHGNLLRVWGGGLIEKQQFYDLCDRLGILVWQEFIQSSSGIDNEPSRDPAYLAYIEAQARQIVPRRRNHPSLIIWCGGNELMVDNRVPITLNHPTNQVFRKVLGELDPDRIFLPTTPSGPLFSSNPPTNQPPEQWLSRMHDVHGNWNYEGTVKEYWHYNTIAPLYHSEFGVEGVTSLADALKIAPLEKLWPVDVTNPLWVHHGDWWLPMKTVEEAWGPIPDFPTLVRCSQFLQADGLRYAVEASRRRKFHTSGCSPWQFNEPWPNLSCTNAVSYFMEPRPVYWWVRHAYEPLHVSLRHDGLAQAGKTEYRAEAWVNNSLEARSGLQLAVHISDLAGKALYQKTTTVNAPADAAARVADIAWKFPAGFRGIFLVSLELRANDHVESSGVYLHSTEPDPPLQVLQHAPATRLQVAAPDAHTIEIKNAGSAWALGVWVDLPQSYLSDNYLFLAPGEETRISVEGASAAAARVRAWNSGD